jgi:hypothetical protein
MSTPAFITLTSGEATVLGYKKKKRQHTCIHGGVVWPPIVCTTKQNKTKRNETIGKVSIYIWYIYICAKIVLRDAASTILKLIPS